MKSLSIIMVFLMMFVGASLFAGSRDLGVNVPGAKIDTHLYRSTSKIYQIVKYLRKKGIKNYKKEEFETKKVSVTHLKSLSSRTKWEGINIYRYKKLTYIYIIPRKN